MGKMKEFRRVCTRCGHEWFIPAALAKERMPNKMEIAGAKMQRAGTGMSLISFSRSRKAKRVTDLEDKRNRVAENSRCPSCGSTAFDQSKA